MKKIKNTKVVFILLFCVSVLFLASCQQEELPASVDKDDKETQSSTTIEEKVQSDTTIDEEIQSTTSDDEEVQDDTAVEWINPVDSIDLNNMNLYRKSDNLYFAADGNAKVSLYVNAEKDDNGRFMFDDGQEWMLTVETSFGNYPLFSRRRVQLGDVSYAAFNEYDGSEYNIFHVLVTVTGSASYEIYDCIFDDEAKAFKVVPVYSSMNINPVGSSR